MSSIGTPAAYALSAEQQAIRRAHGARLDEWIAAWRMAADPPPSDVLVRRFRALADAHEILRTHFAHASGEAASRGSADDAAVQIVDHAALVRVADVELLARADHADDDELDRLVGRSADALRGAQEHAAILRIGLHDGRTAIAVLLRALAADRVTLLSVLDHLLDPRDERVVQSGLPPEPQPQYADYAGWQDAQTAAGVRTTAAPPVASGARAGSPRAAQPAEAPRADRPSIVRTIVPAETWRRLMVICRAGAIEPGVALGAVWSAALASAGLDAALPIAAEADAREALGMPRFLGPMLRRLPMPLALGDQRSVAARCRVMQKAFEEAASSPAIASSGMTEAAEGVVFSVMPEDDGVATHISPLLPAGVVAELRWGLLAPRERAAAADVIVQTTLTDAAVASRLTPALFTQAIDGVADPAAAPITVPGAVDTFARLTPDAIAVGCGGDAVTYDALRRASDVAARALAARGLGPGRIVALHCPPSVELMVALLGAMKSGAAFLPIDIRTPARRVAEIVADARAALTVTRADVEAWLTAGHDARDRGDEALDRGAPPLPASDDDGVAYVLYTSGSTGRPKGVAISRPALANYLRWALTNYAAGGGGSIVQTSIGFDLTLTPLFTPLLAGQTTWLMPEANDLAACVRALARLPRLAFLKVTPAQLRLMEPQLAAAGAPLPRVLVIGGEALSYEDFGPWVRSGAVTLVNEYGPTEATVGCCCFFIESGDLDGERGPVPIGRPITNAALRLYDARLAPVAPGERGEIYIAGDGVAEGYLGAPALTAARFIPDPGAGDAETREHGGERRSRRRGGARLYRTGDFAAIDANGMLIYAGRQDEQVKIRGHRLELAEVSAQLRISAGVADAAARVAPGAGGEPSLAGYVVLTPDAYDAHARAAAPRHQDEWRRVFEESYTTNAGAPFAGWTSSYTGAPIPDAEMQAWVDETVDRIGELAPRRLLEIGCGSGLLAAPLIARLEAYHGVDIAAPALDSLARALESRRPPGCDLRLTVGGAHDLDSLPDGVYDTIVVNSVVQYFPDKAYLVRLLHACARRLSPGGHVFIGDVRHLDLLETFLFTVEWARGSSSSTAGDLRRLVLQRRHAERELNLSPAFFHDLPATLRDAFDRADVRLKQGGCYDNELSRYRYDVVLHGRAADPESAGQARSEPRVIRWGADVRSIAELGDLLAACAADALRIDGLRNARVAADRERWRRIAAAPDGASAAAIVDAVETPAIDGADAIEPHALASLAASLGFDSRIGWSDDDPAGLAVMLWRRGAPPPAMRAIAPASPRDARRSVHANQPLAVGIAAALLPSLRDELRERVPDYMIPSYVFVLDALPLNQHGKVAFDALPPPNVARPATAASYAAPRTPLEVALCRVWADVLGVERVGLDDAFFSLGGHSLLAIKLAYRIELECGCQAPLRQVFQATTVRRLADMITASGGAAPSSAASAASARPAPALTPAPEAWHEPFPLTAIQEAYLAGRSPEYGLGGVASHCYLELDTASLDLPRLESALDRVTAAHGMLRAVVHPNGHQQVLPRVPRYRLAVHDLRGLDRAAALDAQARIRRRMSHQMRPLGAWPLLDLRVTRLPSALGASTSDRSARLHVSLDNLLFDGLSIELLTSQLTTLYHDVTAFVTPPPIAFRDCVLHERRQQETPAYQRAREYWRARLADFPGPPELPRASETPPAETRFHRLHTTIAPERWARLKSLAAEAGVTPSAFLCAAFGDVLGLWSRVPRFRLHLTFFNRPPVHPRIDEVVGDFTSLTLLEIDTSGWTSFDDRARAVQDRLSADLEHSQPGGVWVLRELARQGAARRPPPAVVFTSTLGLESLVTRPAATLPFTQTFSTSQTPQVALDHSVYESRGVLHITWDYVAGLFPPDLPEDALESYVAHLERLADAPGAWREPSRSALPLRHRQRIAETNATQWTHPGGRLHDDFWRQVELRPDAPAVLTASESLTYRQLGERTAGLMAALHAAGAAPGSLIAILLEKGWRQVSATLAISTIGAAYVPLDPAWPDERIRRVLGQCDARIVVTRASFADRLRGETLATIEMDDVTPRDVAARPETPAGEADPLAYVLFTSGTTGTPKGVAIRHSGAVNTIRDLIDRFAIGPRDRCLALSNLTFDLSVFDIFGMLAAGGAVVMARDAQWDPAHWHELAAAHRVTIWNSVPTLFEMYVLHLQGSPDSAPPAALRLAMLSGDWIPLSLPDRARALMPSLDVIGMGGATEASIWSVLYPIGAVDRRWKSVPYGAAMRNQQIYVVDERLAPRPPFAVGEIAIGGIGVAAGYYGDPELTAARFRFSPALGARLYLTGDLGRLHPDGNVEILGREDTQVKIQGYRVELGDVEAALRQAPRVKEAVAKAIAAPDGGGKRLAAFVVAADERGIDLAAVRVHLEGVLPRYMIPADLVVAGSLPLTPNGKIDRAALTLPEAGDGDAVEASMDGETERALAAMWEAMLGGPVRDRTRDFFTLGGDSIKTIQLMNTIRQRFGVTVPLREFLAEPTIAGLAAHLDGLTGNAAPAAQAATTPAAMTPADMTPADMTQAAMTQADMTRADTTPAATRIDAGGAAASADRDDEAFPLTDVQFAYWIGRSTGGATNASSHFYNEFAVEALPWHAFMQAVVLLLRRHEMLRAQVRGDGRQIIAPMSPRHLPKHVDLRGLDDAGRARALARLRAGLSHRVYPLTGHPLLTLAATRVSARETTLHVSMDLLICDAYSARVLASDLARLMTPGVPPPARLETSFREAVLAMRAFERTPAFEAARAYWIDRADAFPPAPELPRRARPPRRGRSRFARHAWRMAPEQWQALRAAGGGRGLTPSGVLLAAFGQTLGMWSARPRFAVNVTVFDRVPHHPQVHDLVGVFTNTFLLAIDHRRQPFAAFASQVQARLWSDLEHRQFDAIKFVRERRRRGLADAAGYPVVFTSTLGQASAAPVYPWRGRSTYAISQTSGVWLDCQIGEADGALDVNWDVVEELFPPDSVPQMFATFTRLLDVLSGAPEAWDMECRS